ncbi:uncharacterized protein EMH_0080900 [Eimeria mitis]|uniref:Uncharacterized protein n=1 Tax=Eimeria mitis TaxID=44415 RepID=U6KHV8_9EIME|nr:uncharacterized protein EMH_0080900 [Eimeria mitis]CDJ36361.1 hypothetical protein EMH_0080900 [Eimeria mitis]
MLRLLLSASAAAAACICRRTLGQQWRISVLELQQRQTEHLLQRIDHAAAALAELEVLRQLLSSKQAPGGGVKAVDEGVRGGEAAGAAAAAAAAI